MNFADRIKEQVQAQDTNQKRITKEEFKEAMKTVAAETLEQYPEGGASIMLTGIGFCRQMDKFMFDGKEECTKEEYGRAIDRVFKELAETLTGEAAVLAPMTGAIFADNVAENLFGKQED